MPGLDGGAGGARGGDSECFGGRHERERARGELGAEAGDRHVLPVRIQHQVAVDLVGDDEYVARQLGETQKLVATENRAAGVLRIAKKEEPRVFLNGFPDRVFVEKPTSVT